LLFSSHNPSVSRIARIIGQQKDIARPNRLFFNSPQPPLPTPRSIAPRADPSYGKLHGSATARWCRGRERGGIEMAGVAVDGQQGEAIAPAHFDFQLGKAQS